jgi:hypothetical protein
MDNIIQLPTGRLRIARVVYFTDLLHSDTRELHVGIIAEVSLPEVWGIGTALRQGFSEAELSLMGPTAREILTDPTEYLWPIVRNAFTASPPGQTLDHLLARYASSISILAPENLEVPRKWLVGAADMESVEKRFRVTLEDEYYKFLFPSRDDDAAAEPIFEDEIKAA